MHFINNNKDKKILFDFNLKLATKKD